MINGGEKMDKKRALEILKEKGYKYTSSREAIIDVFIKNETPCSANEVFDMVLKVAPGINFSTIYRNLDLLTNLGIVNKLSLEDGFSHYELSKGGHRHHIICKLCGSVKEIDLCPFREMEKSKLEELDFEPLEHKFEIYGFCSKCKHRKN